MLNTLTKTNYIQVTNQDSEQVETEIIVESPVSLTVNGSVWLTFMCTPIDLDALAVGFLFNEGLIKSFKEVASVRVCQNGRNVDVWLHHKIIEPKKWHRTSGCTGGLSTVDITTFDQELFDNKIPIIEKFSQLQITQITQLLFDYQPLYKKTGGVHTSALTNQEEIIFVTEDIGRNNTLDKIAGRMLIEKKTEKNPTILTTGRVNSDMLQKAVRMRIPLIISRSSPTSLSVHLAELAGITIIGYARQSSFRIYTYPNRISLTKDVELMPSN